MKRVFIVITILVLTAAAAVALGMDHSQTALAQGPQPPITPDKGGGGTSEVPQQNNNQPNGQAVDGGAIQAYPSRQMSYQGRLEINGSPANGTFDLTFRLYSLEVGGTSIWTETQTVDFENGLFSVMLGAVEPLPYAQKFNQQLYLGIQPEGAASELSPRQMLGTVGYAMNLHGGATMVDTNPPGGYSYSFWVYSTEHPAIYGSTNYTDSHGITGYTYGPWDTSMYGPSGVYGYSDQGNGVLGQSDYIGVRGDGYIGVYGLGTDEYDVGVLGSGGSYTGSIGVEGYVYGPNSYGVYGYSSGFDSPAVIGVTYSEDDSCPVGDAFCASGVLANSWGDAYGSFAYALQRSGVIGYTDANGFYAGAFYNSNGSSSFGLLVQGETYVDGDLTVTGAKSGYVVDVAFNAGSEPLERGDVVVVVGADAPILGDIPVMRVQKATAETASGIVGIVDVLYEACQQPAEEREAGAGCGGFDHNVTTIQPGQHLGVVTLGAYQWLKVDASTPIKAGDLLSISPSAGVAARAQEITVEGVSFFAPGTIIGKALADLDSGTGYIPVFVSLK